MRKSITMSLYIALVIAVFPGVSLSASNVEKKRVALYLDLVHAVKGLDGYGYKVTHKGYPWDQDMIVGCGWVKVTYRGYKVTDELRGIKPSNVEHRDSFDINIPIGQNCDFSEYIATPSNPIEIDVVEWDNNYYIDEE